MRNGIIVALLLALGAQTVFAAPPVQANAINPMMPSSETATVTLTGNWQAMNRNGVVSGCLARFKRSDNEKEFIAYTPMDFLCHLPEREAIAVTVAHNPCWEGEMSGGPCAIRPVNPPPGINFNTDATVTPAKPDARAVPQLVHELEAGQWYQGFTAARTLIEYSQTPSTKETVQAQFSHLHEVLNGIGNSGTDEQRRGAIAYLLLTVDAEHSDDLLWLDVMTYPLATKEPWWDKALAALSKHPDKGDKIVPALVNLLRGQTDAYEPVLKVLPVYGAALKPQLSVIYNHMKSRDYLASYDSVDDAMEEHRTFDWFKANHRDPNDPVEVARHNASLAGEQKKYEEQAKNAAKYEPLWEGVVCAAFPMRKGAQAQRVILDDGMSSSKIRAVDCK